MKVTFLSAFKAVPRGTTVAQNADGSLSVNNVRLGCAEVNALVNLGVIELTEDAVKFAPKFNSAAWGKISQAMIEDKDAYTIGGEYEFYNVEQEEFIESKLLNTASHIGRVVSGFAIPAGSSDKKKFNRLTSLNEVYGLGLTKADISDITGYEPRSRR